MAKLKKARVKHLICPTCKGNGFIKVSSMMHDEMVHQCWDCDSEAEFYETVESNNLIDDIDSTTNKLH